MQLERRLGTGYAVGIGLASMVGAGVFFVWAPAAAAAGPLLVVALVIAGAVATLNALSTTQLAMAHPVSGGAYAYGRAVIGPRTGFAAGWLFLWGKTASAAAIALIAGGYLWPDAARPVAAAIVVALAIVNMTGIRSTARVSAVIVTITLAGLAGVVGTALASGVRAPQPTDVGESSPLGVLQAAALLFFAFAGYARMATLGEEVRDPRRTLPRAVVTALAIALAVYATVGVTCLVVLGTAALAETASPLAAAAGEGWEPVVRVVAAIACLGSLVGVLAALSRTSLAMARERDLPGALARISSRTRAPILAEGVIALLAVAGVLVAPPAGLVALSSCAVLGYYGLAHLSALRQPAGERWLPRPLSALGLTGCAVLAVTLPLPAVAATLGILALGFVVRAVAERRRARVG